ncbi:MBOAT family protein [uncultured Ruminococcus sp.]|uniref:MBOAT family O-acyltransferase n=1 Tax=uncultured Ruminococcus sp. TaxID=165186 RepID=UPI0026344384|nr:MBOAT family O-acyltransferase [uncultured Ruminococcus sp.]
MVFSTIEFLFQFLPLFLLGYYLTPTRYRNITLIIGSLIFYAIGSGWYTLLLLLSLFVNYGLSRFLSGSHSRDPQQAKRFFIIGLVYNFGMLVFFKYTNFLIENLNALLSVFHVVIPEVNLIMPLGISFYTFQITSYLIDVYTGKIKPARNILDLGTYMCMFPQLISGPICCYNEISPQLRNRHVDVRLLEEGMETFVLGLGAKTLLANPMGGLWNNLTVIGFDSISTPYAWLGAFAYSFQIYFDFSGYSMMAIGVGKMLGFDLPQNFNLPYMSGSASEFWRRWHITLGRWFRNYIYIPLGGNRQGKWKTIRNMLAVWAFTGLWHGASWNYVLWGLIFFVLLTLEKNVYGKFLERTYVLKHLYIIFLIPLTWMVFAIPDMHQLGIYFTRLFPFLSSGEIQSNTRDVMLALSSYWKILIPCVLFCTPIPLHYYKKYHKSGFCILVLLLIFIFAIRAMMTQTNNPFLYFQF